MLIRQGWGRMPRLIWVFAGRTVILLVLSSGDSITDEELINATVICNHLWGWGILQLWGYWHFSLSGYMHSYLQRHFYGQFTSAQILAGTCKRGIIWASIWAWNQKPHGSLALQGWCWGQNMALKLCYVSTILGSIAIGAGLTNGWCIMCENTGQQNMWAARWCC